MTKKRIELDTQAYITLAYLSTVAVGMMFDYKYYREYGINIFEYADILDFLLAPVKNLEVIAFVAITAFFIFLGFWADNLWQKKSPKSYSRMNFGISVETIRRYRPIIIIFSSVAYLIFVSEIYGEKMYERFEVNPRHIEITYESGAKVIQGKFIGKNSTYIFLQSEDEAIKAVPIASDVQEIVISRP